MRTIVWSIKAQRDLHRTVSYRSDFDPDEAEAFRNRLYEVASALGGIPTGHPGRRAGTFEKSVPALRYIMVYALDRPLGTVTVLRLVHSSQRFPRDIWSD